VGRFGGEHVVEHAEAAPVAVDLDGEQVMPVATAHHIRPGPVVKHTEANRYDRRHGFMG